ncbi:MAG: TetR family transcriptional regulator [Myxococcota bacterium]|nr:TetR family transcriptional regulator [Myxococcota bacterium]
MPAARRREAILHAFRQEALACGSIAGVGIRAVVERAGCAAPVLYRLFGDRAGLVRAAVRSTHLPMIERLEALAAGDAGPAAERIARLAHSYLGREPGDAEAFEALVNVECRSHPELARWVREVFGRFESLLVAAVEEGVRRGEFRGDVDPAYVAWRLIDLGLFRNQVHLMGLERPRRIAYAERAVASLLAEIAA